MKIKIVNGDKFDETFEVEAEILDEIDSIKCEICEKMPSFERWHLLIYKNFILDDAKCFGFYKCSDNDEVWCGRLESFLTDDDIIVTVFLAGSMHEFVHLVVKRDILVSDLRVILGQLNEFCNEVVMWNVSGESLQDGQLVCELDDSQGNNTILLHWQDEFELTFEDSIRMHDRDMLNEILFVIHRMDSEPFTDDMRQQLDHFGEIVLSIVSGDERLNENLTTLSKSYQNWKFVFSKLIASRIWEICDDFEEIMTTTYIEKYCEEFDDELAEEEELSGETSNEDRCNKELEEETSNEDRCNKELEEETSNEDRCNKEFEEETGNKENFYVEGTSDQNCEKQCNEEFEDQSEARSNCGSDDESNRILFVGFEDYFRLALCVAALEFLDKCSGSLSTNENVEDNLLRSILHRAVSHLRDESKNWRIMARLFWDRFLLRSYNDDEMDAMYRNESEEAEVEIDLQKHGKNVSFASIPVQTTTVMQARKAISFQIGVPLEQVYLIESGGNTKPDDKGLFSTDKFDYFCELVNSMDNIEFLRKLGQGAWGDVFLVQNKQSNQQFVLKKPRNSSCLYRDISIQTRISLFSANISNHLGLYNHGGSVCVAMEYMAGGSLEAYLKSGQVLSEAQIARISRQLLSQIDDMHTNKVVHRDIKSDNIMFDQDHNARLIDFGLSKCTEDLPIERLLENLVAYKPGTIYYMAPEVLNGKPYTEKIDTWSFGATVVEMVTRKRPYSDLKPIQAAVRLAKTRKIDYSPPNPISKELTNFIDSCLNPDPNDRPTISQMIYAPFIVKFSDQISPS